MKTRKKPKPHMPIRTVLEVIKHITLTLESHKVVTLSEIIHCLNYLHNCRDTKDLERFARSRPTVVRLIQKFIDLKFLYYHVKAGLSTKPVSIKRAKFLNAMNEAKEKKREAKKKMEESRKLEEKRKRKKIDQIATKEVKGMEKIDAKRKMGEKEEMPEIEETEALMELKKMREMDEMEGMEDMDEMGIEEIREMQQMVMWEQANNCKVLLNEKDRVEVAMAKQLGQVLATKFVFEVIVGDPKDLELDIDNIQRMAGSVSQFYIDKMKTEENAKRGPPWTVLDLSDDEEINLAYAIEMSKEVISNESSDKKASLLDSGVAKLNNKTKIEDRLLEDVAQFFNKKETDEARPSCSGLSRKSHDADLKLALLMSAEVISVNSSPQDSDEDLDD